ncbi:MAG: lipid A biosynthesis acyltransferase [Myxococcales bacterium]|nr:lipid A biosynthesis acyltransferase [Myxococcales bacterium]
MTREDPEWLSTREKGSSLGIRFLVTCATIGGRRFTRFFIYFAALYFVVFHRSLRRSSRTYWQRLSASDSEGTPTKKIGFAQIYRHVLCFSRVALDRLFFAKRQFDKFEFTHHGHDLLEALEETKSGAILLGAHLGSFEALRALSMKSGLRLNIVGYFRNARMINHALQKLDPSANARFIAIDPKNIESIFKIKECVAKGELIAILGDRTGLSRNNLQANFLGAPAEFPAGIFMLASTLRCPVYLTFGLYHEPNRYDLYCEPFADRIDLPRGQRKEAMASYGQRYADRLEHYCKLAPNNWFNFFEFWLSDASEKSKGESQGVIDSPTAGETSGAAEAPPSGVTEAPASGVVESPPSGESTL